MRFYHREDQHCFKVAIKNSERTGKWPYNQATVYGIQSTSSDDLVMHLFPPCNVVWQKSSGHQPRGGCAIFMSLWEAICCCSVPPPLTPPPPPLPPAST